MDVALLASDVELPDVVGDVVADVVADVELPIPVEGVGFNTLCTDEKAIGIRITLKIF